MNRTHFLLGTLCLALLTSSANGAKPNVVVIVADDLGFADVSFHGKQIRTPNIDRIAREGAELDRFYVCPVCSPTRAGVMTGRYPIRFGLMRAVIPPWRKYGLDLEEVTLPQMLEKAGYAHRGIFGKWHLGHHKIDYHPLRRGFTEFVGHYNGAIDYFTHKRDDELDWHRGYDSNHDEGYSTDLITDAACRFIDRHGNGETPFFAYVPFNAPHGPLQAKKADLNEYSSLADVGPFMNSRGKKGAYGVEGRGKSQRQTLAAMVSSLDEGVGRILKKLDEKQLASNTLVWFFSDNGGTGTGDNRPLNGQKGSVYEGGIRVAAAARWPGHIPAGGRITVPLAYIDVLPTVAHIAGLDTHGGKPLDGINAVDILTGQSSSYPRDLYSYIGQGGEDKEQITLIEPTWKLVVRGMPINDASVPRSEREVELFRIADDPNETTNLATDHSAVVDRMWAKLVTFRSLQPANAVSPYKARRVDFQAPKEWKIAP